MKFEIRKAKFLLPNSAYDGYGDEDLEIYITRKQFMNEFEAGEATCIKLFQYIAEMFTSPNCFTRVPSDEAIRKIYDHLKQHSTAKGIAMQIVQDDKCQLDLGMYIVE